MRNEDVLGWYNLGGTAYVKLDIAEDSTALASVINHETTHHILAATTSYGWLQQAVEAYTDNPFASQDNKLLDQCRDLLFAASRLPQEAAATYCGLAELQGGKLDASVAVLPPFYQSAFHLLEAVLPRNALDPLVRVRAARAIVCRALQTSIVQDWSACGLHELGNLAAYLAEPRNSPEQRLSLILAAVSNLASDQILEWAGRHQKIADEIRLVPEKPPAMAGLDFFEMPATTEWLTQVRRILRTLSVEVKNDAEIIPLVSMEVAIQPNTFSSRNLQPEQIDAQSCGGTDFVMVDRNVSDHPLLAGDFQIPAGHSRITFYRPDSRVPVQTIATLDATPEVIDAADPDRRATVCFGGYSLIPDTGHGAGRSLDEFLHWVNGREVLLYSLGQRKGLIASTMLLERSFGRLQNHAMLMGRDWGLVMFRSVSGVGPLVIHPALIGEWQRHLPALAAVTEIELNVESSVFFQADHQKVIPVLRFARAFTGDMFTPEDWREYCQDLGEALIDEPMHLVNPSLKQSEFDDDNQEH